MAQATEGLRLASSDTQKPTLSASVTNWRNSDNVFYQPLKFALDRGSNQT